MKLLIGTIQLHELIVSPGFHDSAAVNNVYAMSSPDRRKPMCDNDRGLSLHETIERIKNQFFRCSIQTGCRLIEDQDRRVANDRTSDRDSLPLTARQRNSTLTDRQSQIPQAISR